MKKITIILTTLFICLAIKGQDINYIAHADEIHYIYAGTLPKNSVHVVQKLKIEVFGGSYSALHTATTTYSICTRDANRITIGRTGGSHEGYELVAYDNGTSYDFVIKVTVRFVSLNIKVTQVSVDLQFNNIVSKQNIDIKKYNPLGKRVATSDFTTIITTSTDADGFLGIGTLTPQAKLDVRGKIIADQIEVKVNKIQVPDFVFSPDYDLKPLTEIEDFVKKNRHLPEIPSEKEMKANGLNLNEMQMKLLQKIEELTLYTIEQQKQLDEQSRQIKELQQELLENQ